MAVAHVTDTVEGIINGTISYHYDVGNDVLYVRVLEHLRSPTYGDENDDGIVEDRLDSNDQLVGFTVVNWWKRFGTGPLPDSLSAIGQQIEPLTTRLAA
jgi:hypothetical protein